MRESKSKYIFCRIFHLRKTYGMKMRFEVASSLRMESTVKWKIWRREKRRERREGGGTRVENNLFKVSKAATTPPPNSHSLYGVRILWAKKMSGRENYADKGEKNVKRKKNCELCLGADLEKHRRMEENLQTFHFAAREKGVGRGSASA